MTRLRILCAALSLFLAIAACKPAGTQAAEKSFKFGNSLLKDTTFRLPASSLPKTRDKVTLESASLQLVAQCYIDNTGKIITARAVRVSDLLDGLRQDDVESIANKVALDVGLLSVDFVAGVGIAGVAAVKINQMRKTQLYTYDELKGIISEGRILNTHYLDSWGVLEDTSGGVANRMFVQPRPDLMRDGLAPLQVASFDRNGRVVNKVYRPNTKEWEALAGDSKELRASLDTMAARFGSAKITNKVTATVNGVRKEGVFREVKLPGGGKEHFFQSANEREYWRLVPSTQDVENLFKGLKPIAPQDMSAGEQVISSYQAKHPLFAYFDECHGGFKAAACVAASMAAMAGLYAAEINLIPPAKELATEENFKGASNVENEKMISPKMEDIELSSATELVKVKQVLQKLGTSSKLLNCSEAPAGNPSESNPIL